MNESDPRNKPAEPPLSLGGGAFGSLRALGECQLQIQFTLASGYDTQAMGLLGLDVALAAAVAGGQLLGRLWWIALIGLLASGLLAGSALFIRAEGVGLDLRANMANAEAGSTDEIDRGIAVTLSDSIVENACVLEEKSDRVGVGMLLLIATIVGATVGVLAF